MTAVSAEMTAHAVVAPAPTPRLQSVDLVRGLVMVIMALDHVRDFFHRGATQGDPELLADPGLGLFFTRWITHFCAPSFVFLAGTGAFLSLGRGKTPAQLSGFLASRGLWLIILEITLVGFGWSFRLSLDFLVLQVIWALGVSMIVLAALVRLPLPVIGGIGAVIVLGHNALDGVHAVGSGVLADIWRVLHEPTGLLRLGREAAGTADLFGGSAPEGRNVYIRYPVLPWIGVMLLGYVFGSVLRRPDAERRRLVWQLGAGAVLAFVLLRASNLYGDARLWSVQADAGRTLISFLNTQKYPPSLLFLLMTLGPMLLLLNVVEHASGWWAKTCVMFGRVPLFYYVLHIPLIHVLVIPTALIRYGPTRFAELANGGPPPGWGFGLPGTYAMWALVILLLYPVCRWFAGVKARRRDWWLSYM